MNENEEKVVTRVTGFIEPVFIGVAPDGKTLNGVGPEDWQRIQEGYACGECLAMFNTFTLQCPVCHTNRLDVPMNVPAPQDWIDHLKERENPSPKPPLRSPLEAIYGVKDDPDVEQVPVAKLRRKR